MDEEIKIMAGLQSVAGLCHQIRTCLLISAVIMVVIHRITTYSALIMKQSLAPSNICFALLPRAYISHHLLTSHEK